MNRWGIRARVLVLALLPSIMILITLVGYFTYSRIAEVDVLLAQRGVSLARQLAPGAEFALFAGDRAALERLAAVAMGESDVAAVAIYDVHGHLLVQSGRAGPAQTEDVVRFTQPVVATRIEPADFPEQARSENAPAKIGEVSVTMSRSAAHARQRELLLVGLSLGLAFVLVAIALALAIGNSVIRPIRRLADAMAQLRRGDPVPPLPTDGGGEFRTLSDGFNRMAERLQADATVLKRQIDEATRALIAQKDAAEHATNAKSRFIAAASHDLRQPLHAIRLFASTLQRRGRGTGLESIVLDLAQAVAVMDRLFDSILDVSRLDAGSLPTQVRSFPLQSLFDQLAAEHSDDAVEKRLRLRVRPTSAVVDTDELLLHRLLGNLVANAVRYTDTGGVMVCARHRGGGVEIQVRDSGIGIPEDKQRDIFEEFYQIGNGSRDRGHGLGLGLAIVARIARLLGTEVRVRSAPGRGSVFSLRLPRGSDDPVPPAAPSRPLPALSDAGRPRVHVLVVDDDPLVLAASRGMLEDLGCDVTTAADSEGAEANLAGLGDRAVLVLCDLWLADNRSGIDLLRRLSALTAAPISGILISGDTRPEAIEQARRAGYTLLHKPVPPATLRTIVMQFAEMKHRMVRPDDRDEDTPC